MPVRLRVPLCELLHFSWIGAANTLATFGLFHLLLFVTSYVWAYILSFAAGIPVSFVLNTRITFGATVNWRDLPAFSAIQSLSFGLGLAILAALVDGLGMGERPASFLQVALTVPFSFLMTRRLIVHRAGSV